MWKNSLYFRVIFCFVRYLTMGIPISCTDIDMPIEKNIVYGFRRELIMQFDMILVLD